MSTADSQNLVHRVKCQKTCSTDVVLPEGFMVSTNDMKSLLKFYYCMSYLIPSKAMTPVRILVVTSSKISSHAMKGIKKTALKIRSKITVKDQIKIRMVCWQWHCICNHE